jgi:hypothetical protein
MSEVRGECLKAEIKLGTRATGKRLTKNQVRALVMEQHDDASVLATTDRKLEAEVYA